MHAASYSFLTFPIFLALVVAASNRLQFGGTDDDKKQVYIVYMGSLPAEDEYSPLSHHVSILQQVVKGRSAADSLVRSYHRSFNAFAARLSSEEAHKISGMEKVLSVFPSKKIHLHTTRSWDFIGLTEREERNLASESDVIIGVIDTGIWPESESFNDQGLGPPPERWKGRCEGGENFTCNNKIIGAQYYGESGSARDNDGHGSHTASIAAGSKVSGVEFYGLAQGNARGGAPSARIAVYKACEEYCSEQQILDAFNDAIDDGVDIISISLGITYNNIPLEKDAIAIGSFHAMEKGVLTVHSAGNDGPAPGTIESTAPWLVSVAASTIDRKILDKVVLGDGQTITGLGINSFVMNGNSPLTFGSDSDKCARICSDGCLDSNVVKGKIVVCERDLATYPFDEPLKKGAVGAIALGTDQDNLTSYVDPLPASTLRDNDIDAFMSYFNSTANPEGTILQSEQMTDEDAPEVAAFSSRGPNNIVPNILKPDITAPGRYILAAYSLSTSPSGNIDDKRTLKYNILSGTSMACPHVSGAAAYVKSFHPHWLTSAIKSALMTTALPMNDTTTYDREFAYGAGQLNPTEAVDPGLVYEITKDEYLAMLCSMNISRYGPCPPGGRTIDQKDLNYPSMAVEVTEEKPFRITFPRSVRNVGFPDSTYQSLIPASSEIKVSVEPSVLSFLSLDEKQSFIVTVEGQGLPIRSMVSSSLEWYDGTHSVRSPIVVYTSGGPLE